MNLAIHLFKKDFRHLRVLLVLWLFLVVLQSVLIGTGLAAAAGDVVLQIIFSMIGMLIPLLQYIALVVIIPLLVQDEPLVGTTAFWFTRPMARQDLLASKGLFIGALLVLPPLLAELIMLICNGVTPRHVLLAVPEVLLTQLCTVLTIWVLASLTRTFARFAVVGIIVVIAMWLVMAGLAIAQLLQGDVFKKLNEFSLTESRGVVASAVVIVLCSIAIVHQYLTRKTARTIAMACLAAAATVAITSAWPVDFLKTAKRPVQGDILKGETVSVAMDSSDKLYSSDAFSFRSSATPKKDLRGNLTVSGLTSGLAASIASIRSKIVYPDGKTFIWDGDGNANLTRMANNNQWDSEAIRHALGGISIVNEKEQSHSYETLFELDSDLFYKYGEMKGVYTADVALDVYKCERVATLRLQKKARFDSGSEHVVVTDVLREPHGCSVILSSKNVKLLFAADARPEMANMMGKQKALYVLRNQKLGQAFVPKQDLNAGASMWMLQMNERLVNMPIRSRYESDYKDSPIDEAWLADADLVRIEAVEVGTLSKSLRIEDFVMNVKKEKPNEKRKPSIKPPASS